MKFGYVGHDPASKTQPRFIHKRYAQCRADKVGTLHWHICLPLKASHTILSKQKS